MAMQKLRRLSVGEDVMDTTSRLLHAPSDAQSRSRYLMVFFAVLLSLVMLPVVILMRNLTAISLYAIAQPVAGVMLLRALREKHETAAQVATQEQNVARDFELEAAVQHVTDLINEAVSHDLSQRIPTLERDSLAQLGIAVNFLLERLQKLVDEDNQLQQMRVEMRQLLEDARDAQRTSHQNRESQPESGAAQTADVQETVRAMTTAYAAGQLSFQGWQLIAADLHDVDLPGIDLSGANLIGAGLGDADLTGANLRGANLTRADFTGAHLSQSYLTGAQMRGVHLVTADLRDADLVGAMLADAYCANADMHTAELSGAVLTGADLSRADLSGAILVEAQLDRAGLRGTFMTAANLERANLASAKLTGAILNMADLRGADLTDADLHNADLSDADLSGACLNGADLSSANLTGARLGGASLENADLTDVIGMENLEDTHEDAEERDGLPFAHADC